MSKLRLLQPGEAPPSEPVEEAAIAAVTAALADGMQRGFILYETAEGIGRAPILAGVATLKGLLDLTAEEFKPGE